MRAASRPAQGRRAAVVVVGSIIGISSCGRTPLEWDEALPGSVAGGSAGRTMNPDAGTQASAGQGGIGGQPILPGGSGGNSSGGYTEGTGGSPADAGPDSPPFDPGGVVPNCGFDSPRVAADRPTRWLGFNAHPKWGQPRTAYLVELTPEGPRNLTPLAETDGPIDLGAWSVDGRFYAAVEQHSANPGGWRVFDVQTAGSPTPVSLREGVFFGTWSPVDSRFYALVGSELLVADAAAPQATERTVPLPGDLLFLGLAWSPDGRYIAFSSHHAPLCLIDTLAQELVLSPIGPESAGGVIWSPDGRYLVFKADGSLFVFNNAAPELDPILIEESSGSEYQWASQDSLIWLTHGNAAAVYTHLDDGEPSHVPLEGQTWLGSISPSGKCLAYEGYCAGSEQAGNCVRTLPPDPNQPPISVGPEDTVNRLWSWSSDHLLLTPDYGNWIWDVPLAGETFERMLITDGLPTDTVNVFAQFNPGGPATWVLYDAYPGPQARLWHRETRNTLVPDLDSLALLATDWSPDGKYYVAFARPPSYPPGHVPLFIQEVGPDALGTRWKVDEVLGSLELSCGVCEFSWQP